MQKIIKSLLCCTCILLLSSPLALGSCESSGCSTQDDRVILDTARSAGRALQAACTPQQYPRQGALLPVTLQNRIADIIWTGGNSTTTSSVSAIFALLTDFDGFPGGPLWRSDYHGKADSWKDATPSLQASMPANETMSHLGVVALHWSEHKPERVLFQGRGKWHWVSSDNGATFTALPSPGDTIGFSQEMKVHPKQADWIMAKVQRNECFPDMKSAACGADLFISKDFGSSWKNLTESSGGKMNSVRDFEWGARLPMYAGKPTPDEAVFATVYPGTAAHKGFYPGWDSDIHYVITLDLFNSPLSKIIPCGNLFEIVSGKIFLAVPSECPVGPDGKTRKTGSGTIGSRSVTLYVSDNDGDEFVEACLPASLEDDGYNLIHTHDNAAAFILADHAEPGSWGPTTDSPTSDAYAPAYNASLHTLSLIGVYRRDFITDFSRVEGLPGVFLANQVDDNGRGPASRGREAHYLRSRLSLNGGATWQALTPPASFRFGQCNTCSPGASLEQCSLHVHGPTSWFAPEGPHPNFYSLPSAPGLILATGNVGPHLDFSPDADCTYLSRDGGITWEDVADNTAIYEIGNKGGIVALAAHRSEGPTDTVKFSLDQGACFHTVKLPEPILVENLRVAPDGNAHVFLVHGTACLRTAAHPDCGFTGGSTPPGKMYAIDVQELLAGDWKECDPAEGSPDYESWTVGGGSPPAQAGEASSCLMGAKRSVRRRSRETFCANSAGWGGEVVTEEPCQCGDADVECEFGWVKNANGTCVEMSGVAVADACPRLSNSGYLSSNTHLRLVHGNECEGVNKLIPDTNGRGGPKGSDSGGGGKGGGGDAGGGRSAIRTFFVFVITCGAVAVAAGLAWSHCLAPQQREALAEKAAPLVGIIAAGAEVVLGVLVDVYDWIRAKVRTLPFIGGGGGGGGLSYDGRGGYEPLSGSGGGLDLDPEDHRSPPLFPGSSMQQP